MTAIQFGDDAFATLLCDLPAPGVAPRRLDITGDPSFCTLWSLTGFPAITLPIIAPALLSGWLMAFTLSLDDLVISSFTSGPSSTTLPMKIFSSVRMGVSPKINALASLMILIVSAAALIAWWSMRRGEKRRQRDMQLALQQS